MVQAARAAGEEKGADGPVVTLSRSLIVPFLQFSPDRELRRRAYEAWAARGANGGKTDNRAIAAEILSLRAERAALLGYPSFADYKLETEMAKTPAAVRDLLMRVWTPARAAAEADAAVLEAMLHADGHAGAAGAVGLALLRGEAAAGRARPRRDGAETVPRAGADDRGGVRLRQPALRAGVRASSRRRSGTRTCGSGR